MKKIKTFVGIAVLATCSFTLLGITPISAANEPVITTSVDTVNGYRQETVGKNLRNIQVTTVTERTKKSTNNVGKYVKQAPKVTTFKPVVTKPAVKTTVTVTKVVTKVVTKAKTEVLTVITTVTERIKTEVAQTVKLVAGCEKGWTSPYDLGFSRNVARCVPGAPAAKPLATREKVIVASAFKLEFNSPLGVAMTTGEFEKENLDVEIKNLSFANAVPQLANGQIDVAVGGIELALFNAARQNLDVRMVMGNYYPPKASNYSIPQTGLWCRRAFFKNPANPDLKDMETGMKWGTSVGKGSVSVYYSVAEIRKRYPKFNPKNIEYFAIPAASILDAMDKAVVDCGILLDPVWTKVASNPAYIQVATQTPGEPLGLYVYGSRMLKDRTDIGDAFMRAFIRTVNTYYGGDYHNDAKTTAEIVKFVPAYDIEANKKFDSLTMDWEIRDGTTTRIQELFIDIGVITEFTTPVAESAIVDRSFYERAVGKRK
jgi:NitT/TauT family transport system substrate-binding protein